MNKDTHMIKHTRLVFVTTVMWIVTLTGCANTNLDGSSSAKNVRVINVERELPFSADEVWQKIFMKYGDSQMFNPKVVRSGYLTDITKAEVGAERYTYYDQDGQEGVHERIVEIDNETKRMRFKIFEARNLPINTSVSYGNSSLTSLDNGKTLFKLKFEYRTEPPLLALFANGGIKKDLQNMMIGVEHHLHTGEQVTTENFKDIQEMYQQ